MHGTVRRYLTPAGAERWEFSIELGIGPDGRRKQSRRRGFLDEAAAREAMDAELVDRRRGQYIEPERTPLGEYMAEYIASTAPTRSPNTTSLLKASTKRMQPIAHIPLGKLQPHQVQHWVNDLAARYAPRTVDVTHAALKQALAQAVRWGHIPANPADRIAIPRQPTRRESAGKAWSAEEASRFLATAAGTPWEAMWRVLLDGQLRAGEAIALRWSDLDLDAGIIRVHRTLTRDADGILMLGATTKTRESRRDVTISPDTAAALRRHRTTQLEQRLAAAWAWEDQDLVFANERGRWFNPTTVRAALDKAIRAADVPRITPHGLRHTGATLLVLAGIPLVVVSRRLGHQNISVTADIYSHVTVHADRAATDALAALLKA